MLIMNFMNTNEYYGDDVEMSHHSPAAVQLSVSAFRLVVRFFAPP